MSATWVPQWVTYDQATGHWIDMNTGQRVVVNTGQSEAAAPSPDPIPETKRACECGVWATGGLHSDWCPCAGGDCAQAEGS